MHAVEGISARRLNAVAEHLAARIIESGGLEVALTKDSGYLLVNGKTVMVKASTYHDRGYRFYVVPPAHVQFIMCLCFDERMEVEQFYLFPRRAVKNRAKLHFRRTGFNQNVYAEYRNTLAPLSR